MAGDTVAALAWLWYGLPLLGRAERSLGFAFTTGFGKGGCKNESHKAPRCSTTHLTRSWLHLAPPRHAVGDSYSTALLAPRPQHRAGYCSTGSTSGKAALYRGKTLLAARREEWGRVLWKGSEQQGRCSLCPVESPHWQVLLAGPWLWRTHTEAEEHVEDGEQKFCYGLFSLHCLLCLKKNQTNSKQSPCVHLTPRLFFYLVFSICLIKEREWACSIKSHHREAFILMFSRIAHSLSSGAQKLLHTSARFSPVPEHRHQCSAPYLFMLVVKHSHRPEGGDFSHMTMLSHVMCFHWLF